MSRVAALILGTLGVADLVYLNVVVGPEVFTADAASSAGASAADAREPATAIASASLSPVPPAASEHSERPQPERVDPGAGKVPASSAPDSNAPDSNAPDGNAPDSNAPDSSAPDKAAPDNDADPPGRGAPPPAVPAASSQRQPEAQRPTSRSTRPESLARAKPEAVVRFERIGQTTVSEARAIAATAAKIAASGDSKIRVRGHADTRGRTEFNRELGLRRANAVIDALVKAGVERSRLVAESAGETQPLDRRGTRRAHAKNRRVEIIFEGG